ncbi:glycine--tRNA ligase subunit beta [Methylotenera sp.]|uniref:glycine--tRNA ligase subunit beta n=1 Tax=Methylotenera sp. TaxID=2051956 RepID=UPI002726F7CC|nr:glycine--tRNA ligase subunit beta [Methylotenera sp.]MDO9206187.1 glycine--tRNA ligase subunit beta [Methylotenera sp.]MDP1523733.1 glycine--tRNA ligase subunit beta [Methylotenera sp.]MDP3308765.1 glycine--tRNA ligase subunit beta [Methylotenera sp.]MDP3818828.1 glycine--tRNA ligase subunit beta [Methylotenera sp.]
MSTKNLLVELFVEELPPKALNKLGEAFASVLFETLKSQGLAADTAAVTAYASPRRLAVHATNILAVAPNKTSTQKLMPVSVGMDASGNATPALIKRLNSMGLTEASVANLTKQMDGKNEALFLDVMQKGISLKDGLQIALNDAITKLPIPKVMTYQLADGWSNVNFVRPAHSLVALHGNDVVAVTALGLTAGNQTQGHRFEASVSPVILKNADTYAEQLKTEGAVIASFTERRAEIVCQLNATAQNASTGLSTSLKPIEDDALLDEVTALVERPNVLLGQFEEVYLEVPQECLILTMKANQKYFPLLDANDKLTNKFLIVSNISPDDASAVIGGNERVVRPRLADAKFFFDQDRKKSLESRISSLDKVVYHNKLGSQGQRTERVSAIAIAISLQLGDAELAAKAGLAAQLAKTDLITDMVGEFPELQGIMGRYYAQHEGLDDEVAFAIEDHYKPRFAGDELARNQVGVVVALADKLETLVGLFSIGEKPTGDKDPFGLRRQALGIIRMLIECKLPLTFSSLIQDVLSQFNAESSTQAATIQAIKEFCFDRLSVNLREQGASPQEVDAVLSLNPEILSDIPQRLAAVRTFSALDEAPALAAANKRVGNILKKIEGEVKSEVNVSLLQEPAEIALNTALGKVKPEADKLFEGGDYTAALKSLAALKAPVDAFFDSVMVNADDPALKANRLGLLASLHQAMNRVADLSKLAS